MLSQQASELLEGLSIELAYQLLLLAPQDAEGITIHLSQLREAALLALPPALAAAAVQGGEAAAARHASNRAASAAEVAEAAAAAAAARAAAAIAAAARPSPHPYAWQPWQQPWQQPLKRRRCTMARAGCAFSLRTVLFIMHSHTALPAAAPAVAFLCGALQAVGARALSLAAPGRRYVKGSDVLKAMREDCELRTLLRLEAQGASLGEEE